MAEEKQVGKITHYFGKIGVAVVELTDELKIGDTIRIVGGTRDFTQTVNSMQIEHQNVERAGAGEAIGLKVDQPVKEGDIVYKVVE
jgi:putative protease